MNKKATCPFLWFHLAIYFLKMYWCICIFTHTHTHTHTHKHKHKHTNKCIRTRAVYSIFSISIYDHSVVGDIQGGALIWRHHTLYTHTHMYLPTFFSLSIWWLIIHNTNWRVILSSTWVCLLVYCNYIGIYSK